MLAPTAVAAPLTLRIVFQNLCQKQRPTREPCLSCGNHTKVPVPPERHRSSTQAAGEPRLPPKTTKPRQIMCLPGLKKQKATLPRGQCRRLFLPRVSYVWYVCAIKRAYRISRFGSLSPVVCRLACDRSQGMGRAQRRESRPHRKPRRNEQAPAEPGCVCIVSHCFARRGENTSAGPWFRGGIRPRCEGSAGATES